MLTCTRGVRHESDQPFDSTSRHRLSAASPHARAASYPVICKYVPSNLILKPHLHPIVEGVYRSSCNQSRGIQFSNGDPPPIDHTPTSQNTSSDRNLVLGFSVFCCPLPWSVVRAILWTLDTLTVPNNNPISVQILSFCCD